MALTAAERNKRKRERKKRERAEEAQKRLKRQEEGAAAEEPKKEESASTDGDLDVEIEYVAEPLPLLDSADRNDGDGKAEGDAAAGHDDDDLRAMEDVLRRFRERAAAAAAYVTDDEATPSGNQKSQPSRESKLADFLNRDSEGQGDDEEGEDQQSLSKRQLKNLLRPTIAQLKQSVAHPELVEAHDVTAPDPEFLTYLKGVSGTVPVPRHWGRKRKYLQGKRGIEKPPFALPDFILKTGISSVRDATAQDEAKMSVKQKNRLRVSGRAAGVDVDYRTLYEAFFVHQTKPKNLTDFGDLYYEGKEYEIIKSCKHFRPGYLSERLREALGMANEFSPPPWLINMQRYGPPPSYPNVRIPGLNAPLPAGASYGYHVGGWGKPPVDAFGRPLYGGDPFGTPEELKNRENPNGGNIEDGLEDLYGLSGVAGGLVTSDGKAIGKKSWGALPNAFGDEIDRDDDEDDSEEEESSSEEESTEDEMDESEEEEGEEKEKHVGKQHHHAGAASTVSGMQSVLPDGVDSVVPSSAIDLRKQPGDETPMVGGAAAAASGPPKQLYTVLQQTTADKDAQQTSVFASDHAYILPGAGPGTGMEGMASVLSKANVGGDGSLGRAGKSRSKRDEEEEAEELGKNFKF
mmetsp:Transcript_20162/g.41962  ORF Transcript_20162/g.41962 Transcript_20162/m.41962 type:complete len:632 (+) Transcript_20162:68-1963(+)|eukprot:CAMPEP_0171343350 /NCGR_PEP_ID=MMETSP0878-20121228/16915_1 /TAXON_ID=67004 /ORGANISM="Thalassiosira weissflogii, Strain CCMP1336" /LENGTH=631 /DNA_ID=CAMNT_0011846277 /DNA_START=41 /DNA_END=1936 /DNA_ORIENTATION=-